MVKSLKRIIEDIKEQKFPLLISIILLIISIIFDYLSGTYTSDINSVPINDLILDHIPLINLKIIFVYGYILVISLFFIYPLLSETKHLSYVITQFSLLVSIRSLFLILTHLKDPAEAIIIKFPSIISNIAFTNDLFFSGHAAISFLGFLIFYKRSVRYFFLISSFVLSLAVLFMHIHYSIDVFAAYFIAYGSYKIGNRIFSIDIPVDCITFRSGMSIRDSRL